MGRIEHSTGKARCGILVFIRAIFHPRRLSGESSMLICKAPLRHAMRWLSFLAVASLGALAQVQTYTLSGTVRDTAAHGVPNATVSAKSLATGKAYTAKTNSDGGYAIEEVAAGDYEVSAVAGELQSPPIKVTVASAQTTDLTVSPAPSEQPAPQESAPQDAKAPSLSDLGFTAQQTQANPELQARLAKHTEMLKIHQRLGLITTIPMAAAVFTGPLAKAKGKNGQIIKEPTDANLDFHAALGGLTAALYFTTASYAIFAPRIPNNPKHGGIKWHEALAFVHGPGMVLTPILGAMAYHQESLGEKPHGIAAQHGTVAYVTAIAYGTSIIAVSWPIHLKFWEKR
jgi:hypothetical protein